MYQVFLNFIIFSLQSDVSLKGYSEHKVAKSADAPLTYAEEEMKEINQVHIAIIFNVHIDQRQCFVRINPFK